MNTSTTSTIRYQPCTPVERVVARLRKAIGKLSTNTGAPVAHLQAQVCGDGIRQQPCGPQRSIQAASRGC